MSFYSGVVVLSMVMGATSGAWAARWNAVNDPAIMDENFVYDFARLPLKAELAERPWSETYWPSQQGSINLRWNLKEPDGFGYASPTKEQAQRMTLEELKTLAPSEKYDLLMGRYDYPLKREVTGIATPRAREWSGLCDGWAIAALHYREPAPVTLTNPDGIAIPFGSSDVKGLMSYHAARHFETRTKQVGTRCFKAARWVGAASCADINPGSLHVILANQIGLKKQGFVVERDAGHEVWNQPAYGYAFQVVGSAKPEEGARAVRVKGTLYYTDELDNSLWEPVTGTKDFVEGKIEMDYIVDLDSNGQIIGGSWVSGSDRPDFVWLPVSQLVFGQEMDGLNRIYKPIR
jgi:hypothetical protein